MLVSDEEEQGEEEMRGDAATAAELLDLELGASGPMPRQITQIDCSKGEFSVVFFCCNKQKSLTSHFFSEKKNAKLT